MRKVAVAAAVIGALAAAGGAGAAGRWVITNINQIKPTVRHQLRGNTGLADRKVRRDPLDLRVRQAAKVPLVLKGCKAQRDPLALSRSR